MRALIAVMLINCNFYAFTKLPLADVTAIGFSRNLFLALLAVPILSEKMSVHRALATIIGFAGILIIIRPGQGIFEGAAVIAVAGACLGATMMILIRKLTVSDSNLVMMTYPSMAIVLVTSVPTYLFWLTPTGYELVLLIIMSFMGIFGQWCMIQAFRLGEATAVAPASYMRLIFATIIGYLLFAEIPDVFSIYGTLIIVGSNLYLIFLEGRVSKTRPGERVPGDVT
jgi:drug/metabolite transporter (DMT)-like permease